MNKLLDQNMGRIWSSLIINELISHDITQFYLSPGMRNAPLIAAIDHLQHFNSNITIKVCIDERAAGYRALGYSKATGSASVLICTSGTAMANYMPAIIEAKKTNLPLIIITADRPPELTHCDDNQTIDQTKFYGDFVNGELNLGPPSIDISPWALTSSLSNLIHKAHYPQKGPVHFNAPFREPLENNAIDVPKEYIQLAQLKINEVGPSTKYLELETRLTKNSISFIGDEINNSKNGILVIGSLGPSENLYEIESFIKHLNWPTYFDVSSSLKYKFNLKNNTFPTFDHPEVQDELLKNPPDTIFHIGGRLTSKHYYSFLKNIPNINLMTLSKNIEKEDPSHHTKFRLNADIVPTLIELQEKLNSCPTRSVFSLNFEAFAKRKIEIIEKGELTYPKISKTIIDKIKNKSALYIGNSTVVRSFDSYFSFDTTKDITIATNRGVSGIEGLIASAVGLIDGINHEVYLVIGDISFMHDLNSLYFLHDLKHPLKIILINNFSGGIFTLLPINAEKNVINYISSPHTNTFANASKLAGIHYQKAETNLELVEEFEKLQSMKTHSILEILVNNELNIEMYNQLKTIKI